MTKTRTPWKGRRFPTWDDVDPRLRRAYRLYLWQDEGYGYWPVEPSIAQCSIELRRGELYVILRTGQRQVLAQFRILDDESFVRVRGYLGPA